MHRILSSFLVVLLVVASVGFGCAAPASSPKATAPCEVSLHAVNKVFCGKESTTLEVVFTIHNPNKGVVALNELTYNLSNGDNPLGTGGTNTTVYIPAGKEVRVKRIALGVQRIDLIEKINVFPMTVIDGT